MAKRELRGLNQNMKPLLSISNPFPIKARLYKTLSVVGRSCYPVGQLHLFFFFAHLAVLMRVITAPAKPHTTDIAVYIVKTHVCFRLLLEHDALVRQSKQV